MADLSNLKISSTFSRLLQLDPNTVELQDGGGSKPASITFNRTTLKYVDGNEALNYVLTSDAAGNASWASAGGSDTAVYWSASSVDGTFIVNSGVTSTANPNKVGIGTLIPNKELSVSGTVSASTEILAGDGDGFISAATIDAPILSGISTYGDTIYSGSTNLADVLISLSADSDYWSASTSGNITVSGLSTTVQTEGDLRVSGTVYTTNIQTTGSTSADTLSIEAGEISLRNRDGVTEYLKVGPAGFTFLLNDTEAVTFNDGNQYYYFDGRPGSGTDWYTFNFHGDKGYDVMLLDPEWEVSRFRKHVAISDTYALWPNAMATQYGLYVSGSSRFLSGGTRMSTNAIEAVGDISGTTDLYLDGNLIVTGNTVMNGTLSATTSLKVGNGDGFISATTINAPTISATTLYGTIDGGSF
tara:strand:+ start:4451 stop:5698 length:1248 start_codon:yes stop_codon:yes gene_type:complete